MFAMSRRKPFAFYIVAVLVILFGASLLITIYPLLAALAVVVTLSLIVRHRAVTMVTGGIWFLAYLDFSLIGALTTWNALNSAPVPFPASAMTEAEKFISPLYATGLGAAALIWPKQPAAKLASHAFWSFQPWLAAILALGILFVMTRAAKGEQNIFSDMYESIFGGVARREKHEERGSARWARSGELRTVLKFGPSGTILGLDGRRPLFLPLDSRTMNQNIIIFGPTGSRKTRSIMQPAIFQAVENCESIVITDPKGELAKASATWIRAQGYEVKILNLVDIAFSDQFNPMGFVNNAQDALDLASALVDNSPSGEKKTSGGDDQFWDDAMRSYYQALILYIVHELPNSQKHLGNLLEIAARWGSDQAKLEELFAKLDPQHPARRAFELGFKVAEDKTRSGILISAASRIGLWQSLDVCSLTSGTNGIDIADIGRKKTAVFLILSDTKNTMRPLSSMFFNQLFSTLFQVADQNGGTLPVKVRIIADELANIGRIHELDKRLSITRSRGIGFVGVFQNKKQMETIYPAYESIRSSCDVLICLGSNDNETSKYISDSLGDQTIETESQSQKISEVFNGSNSRSTSSRKLMAPDEILRLDNDEEIVILRGQFPARLKKYDFSMHPAAKEMRETRIENWPFATRAEVEYFAPPEIDQVAATSQDGAPSPSTFFGEDF
ncbi:membrane hypothetical protein [Candidatus Desulfosporosinus infrequens]|uniref:Type IV secretory pathway, VirD4 component n=1 Tax=Candidatus Desulfosporosinus infrequens TaxID=2043169 RepID=A0A2U3LR11_9FIRM|nr:membrane hypothetical protein [Candidatus Desulfosporosinus infrequens]